LEGPKDNLPFGKREIQCILTHELTHARIFKWLRDAIGQNPPAMDPDWKIVLQAFREPYTVWLQQRAGVVRSKGGNVEQPHPDAVRAATSLLALFFQLMELEATAAEIRHPQGSYLFLLDTEALPSRPPANNDERRRFIKDFHEIIKKLKENALLKEGGEAQNVRRAILNILEKIETSLPVEIWEGLRRNKLLPDLPKNQPEQ
jgi:hypothetical protein